MSIKQAGSVYILVIEDDRSVREFLADQLAGQGYKVMTSDNGAEAVECVQNSKFHVVISDLRMPGMDGIQTLEAIKKIDP
jgi:two-component system, NtrC family, response regulator AtoC